MWEYTKFVTWIKHIANTYFIKIYTTGHKVNYGTRYSDRQKDIACVCVSIDDIKYGGAGPWTQMHVGIPIGH